MRSLLDTYWAQMRIAVISQFQYRVANYLYMLGLVAEPVIYLVVWSTVARAQGGTVAGYTPAGFAAYYIVWTLVRNMNIVLTPYDWERRIRSGEFSGQLLRPIHPIHLDIAYMAGWKPVVIVMWLPIAAVLIFIFRPALNPELWQIGAFFVALWGGFFIRFALLWAMGLVTFWTTRVSALFELYFALELLLSGRLVPLALMPEWARRLAAVLPFQWAFGFPIEVLIGRLTPMQTLAGLGAQVLWAAAGFGVMAVVWRVAVRRFSAVGG